MSDICNFIPNDEEPGIIKYYHFVYETGLKKLRQPFLNSFYRLHLAVKGEGILKKDGKEYPLESGTLFLTHPYHPYELDGSGDFTYFYISFDGDGVAGLLKDAGQNGVYPDFDHVLDFWMTSIRRVNSSNAAMLTESVLKYTLSFVGDADKQRQDKFEIILEYLSNHYSDMDISLKKVADIFFYSEKYLSALFKKKMNIKFTDHLNNLRIDAAQRHIKNERMHVSELAEMCGFSDAYYFSRVFKKITGKTPTDYMKGF